MIKDDNYNYKDWKFIKKSVIQNLAIVFLLY